MTTDKTAEKKKPAFEIRQGSNPGSAPFRPVTLSTSLRSLSLSCLFWKMGLQLTCPAKTAKHQHRGGTTWILVNASYLYSYY